MRAELMNLNVCNYYAPKARRQLDLRDLNKARKTRELTD